MIVLLDGGEQRHIINKDRKTVTCLAWAAGGSHLVSGESGHKPAVKVWSLQAAESPLVSLTGHKFGVGSVSFSPDTNYVISVILKVSTPGHCNLLTDQVGTEHDMVVNVWDWRNSVRVASNKMSFNVTAISIARDGSHFVAAGNR